MTAKATEDVQAKPPTREAAVQAPGERIPKPHDVTTSLDFLRYAYGGKRKLRVSLKGATAKKLSEAPAIDRDHLAEVLNLAARDQTLATTLAIMTALERAAAPRPLRDSLDTVIVAILAEHPVGRDDAVQDVLQQDAESDEPEVGRALAALAKWTERELARKLADVKLKPVELRALRSNAAKIIVMRAAWRYQWTEGELIRRLDEHLWRREFNHRPPVAPRADLVELDTVVGGLVSNAWRRDVEEAGKRRHDAEQIAAAERAQSAQGAEELAVQQNRSAQLSTEVDRLKSEVGKLHDQLRDAQRALSEAGTQASYDYETLRARVQHRLRRETELLQEGLHALRRNKVHVMEDHAERALEALEAELRYIEGGNDE